MKKILFLILISLNLYSSTLLEYLSSHPTQDFRPYSASVCFGSNDSENNTIIHTSLEYDYVSKYKNYWSSGSSNQSYLNTKIVDGIPCVAYVIDPRYDVGDLMTVYIEAPSPDESNTDNYPYAYVKYRVTSFEDVTPDCETTPPSSVINGYNYQTLADSDESCEMIYNENGDGTGYYYSNIDLTGTCDGFCYYNEANDDNPDDTPDDNPDDNPDDTPDDNPDNTTVYNTIDLDEIIPFIDDLEDKNTNINDSILDLNSILTTEFNNINANNSNLNDSVNNIDSTLGELNTTLENLNSSISDLNNSNSDDDISSDDIVDYDINPDVSDELSGFQNEAENLISSSFSSYSDVFGFGGYSSAPSSISFNMFGKTITIFDITILEPYISTIRNVFLISAYIFGLLFVFKGD